MHRKADAAPVEDRRVYQAPVVVEAGSFRVATRGLTQIDREIRIGKKAE